MLYEYHFDLGAFILMFVVFSVFIASCIWVIKSTDEELTRHVLGVKTVFDSMRPCDCAGKRAAAWIRLVVLVPLFIFLLCFTLRQHFRIKSRYRNGEYKTVSGEFAYVKDSGQRRFTIGEKEFYTPDIRMGYIQGGTSVTAGYLPEENRVIFIKNNNK